MCLYTRVFCTSAHFIQLNVGPYGETSVFWTDHLQESSRVSRTDGMAARRASHKTAFLRSQPPKLAKNCCSWVTVESHFRKSVLSEEGKRQTTRRHRSCDTCRWAVDGVKLCMFAIYLMDKINKQTFYPEISRNVLQIRPTLILLSCSLRRSFWSSTPDPGNQQVELEKKPDWQTCWWCRPGVYVESNLYFLGLFFNISS